MKEIDVREEIYQTRKLDPYRGDDVKKGYLAGHEIKDMNGRIERVRKGRKEGMKRKIRKEKKFIIKESKLES